MKQDSKRPQIVIIGGGFAGLEAAQALARSPVDIILLDRQNHHCFQPLLYQVATAALSPADIAWPIRFVLRRQSNVRVLLAQVTGIDPQAQVVRAGRLTVPYDYLVIATGVTHAYFGHDEWAKAAPGLKSIEDAREIRARFLLAVERAEIAEEVGNGGDPARLDGIMYPTLAGGLGSPAAISAAPTQVCGPDCTRLRPLISGTED